MISLKLLGLVQQYPGLLALKDMLGMKANQLQQEHLHRIAQAFNVDIPFHAEILDAFIALLKGHDVNSVADIIQDPESIQDLVVFLTGGFNSVVASKQPDVDEPAEVDLKTLFIGNN